VIGGQQEIHGLPNGLPLPVGKQRGWRAMGILAILLTAASGCSKPLDKWEQRRPATFPGSGIVTHDGTPIEGAVVAFDSVEHNLTAVGRTDAEGRFVLKTFTENDGIVAGEHRVRITKVEVTGYSPEGYPLGEVNRLPQRYADSSGGLRATVDPENDNVFRFELTTGKPAVK
jgi:hypothetical protein